MLQFPFKNLHSDERIEARFEWGDERKRSTGYKDPGENRRWLGLEF